MAPTKKKADPKLKVAKKSEDRVVKRPARGFHRFRNGMLNVTPKGGEKELVKRNQNSPLLRLPAELRRQIWEYALGGTTFRRTDSETTGLYRWCLAPPVADRPHGLNLLRACRQIYSETALLPCSSNIFSFFYYDFIKYELKALRPFQRASITRIQFANCSSGGKISHMGTKFNFDFLPALKHIHIMTFTKTLSPSVTPDSAIKSIQAQLGAYLVGRQVEVVYEVKESDWRQYRARWNRPEDAMN